MSGSLLDTSVLIARDANGALDLLPPPDRIQYHVAYTNVAMSLYRECGVELARR